MQDLLPLIVSGIVSGSIFGLAATGLTLTYKTTGILNFGHGAIATAAAYLFYFLHVQHGMDWKLAAFLCVVVLGCAMGALMQVICNPLARQGVAWKIVGTVGLILVVQSLGSIIYGTDALFVQPFLPGSSTFVDVVGVRISYDQILMFGISLVAVAALFAFFRWSRMGVAMRAVVDDSDLVDMMGIKADRVRRTSWMVGSMFAALSGVLVVPGLGLEPIALTLLVVQAFAAAAIGAFSSIPLTFAGGLILGVVTAIPVKYAIEHPSMAGLPDSVPFILLFVVLLVLPKRKLVSGAVEPAPPPGAWHGPGRQRAIGAVVVLTVLILVPFFVGQQLSAWTLGLTQMILLLSLGLLVRTAGQVSLCHVAFAAVGAVAFSQLYVNVGLPWLLAVVLGALIVVPVGALVALPAIRLSGVFLALATLGFGIMVERLLYPTDWMFTQTSTEGREMPRPSFATSDTAFFYVVLGFVVVTALCIVAINAGRLGRVLRGLGEAPVAVFTLGLNLNVSRLLVFCISAFLAGLGGILYGCLVHFASSSDPRFGAFNSLILIVTLALLPMRDPWYAVIGGVTAVIPAYIPGTDTPYWMSAIFGLFAILVAMQGGAPPMPAKIQRLLTRKQKPEVRAAPSDAHLERVSVSGPGLEVNAITVRFGGLVAVNNVSIKAATGQITGLIGPNGAGKTTTFNACSGIVRPTAGRIMLDGRDITRLPADRRARLGLGRTFQLPQLADSFTVFDNVALGWEAGRAGRNPVKQILAGRSERRAREAATWAALEMCGLEHLARKRTSSVSTGQRRLIELARALAGDFELLLLDEPSAGLDNQETAEFGNLLVRVVAERGCGILLVEHDMSLVMRICDHIHVLDYGREIFAGTPAQVAASPEVRLAYLGDEDPDVHIQAREEVTQ